MAPVALAQLALQLLPTVTTGAKELWGFIRSVRTAARQDQQWTDATEALYQQRLEEKTADPAYQPDPPAA